MGKGERRKEKKEEKKKEKKNKRKRNRKRKHEASYVVNSEHRLVMDLCLSDSRFKTSEVRDGETVGATAFATFRHIRNGPQQT